MAVARANASGVDPSHWAADKALIEKQCKGVHAHPKLWGKLDGFAMRSMKLNYGSVYLRALLHVKGAASRTRPLPVLRNAVVRREGVRHRCHTVTLCHSVHTDVRIGLKFFQM